MRVVKLMRFISLLLLTACAASSPAARETPAVDCAPWPSEVHLSLTPENRRYLIALSGLRPDEPFSLRYTLRRGDFSTEAVFDGRAGPEGAYNTYSVSLPQADTSPSPYPSPAPSLGGLATYWRFRLLRADDGGGCLEVVLIP